MGDLMNVCHPMNGSSMEQAIVDFLQFISGMSVRGSEYIFFRAIKGLKCEFLRVIF